MHLTLIRCEWQKETDTRERYRTGVNGNWKKPSSLTKNICFRRLRNSCFRKTSVIRFPNIPGAHAHIRMLTNATHTYTCTRCGKDSRKSVRYHPVSNTHKHPHPHLYFSRQYFGRSRKDTKWWKKESIALHWFSIEIDVVWMSYSNVHNTKRPSPPRAFKLNCKKWNHHDDDVISSLTCTRPQFPCHTQQLDWHFASHFISLSPGTRNSSLSFNPFL